jgi:hypothetical protein
VLLATQWQPGYKSCKLLQTACEESADPIQLRKAPHISAAERMCNDLPLLRGERLPPPKVAHSKVSYFRSSMKHKPMSVSVRPYWYDFAAMAVEHSPWIACSDYLRIRSAVHVRSNDNDGWFAAFLTCPADLKCFTCPSATTTPNL